MIANAALIWQYVMGTSLSFFKEMALYTRNHLPLTAFGIGAGLRNGRDL